MTQRDVTLTWMLLTLILAQVTDGVFAVAFSVVSLVFAFLWLAESFVESRARR